MRLAVRIVVPVVGFAAVVFVAFLCVLAIHFMQTSPVHPGWIVLAELALIARYGKRM